MEPPTVKHPKLYKLHEYTEIISAILVFAEVVGLYAAYMHSVGDVVHPVAAMGTIYFLVSKA